MSAPGVLVRVRGVPNERDPSKYIFQRVMIANVLDKFNQKVSLVSWKAYVA